MGYKVAVVGATGNVGREMLNILAERTFPADEVVVLASRKSMGQEVSYGDKTLKVKALENFDFSDTDICLMSAGGAVSKEWSPKIAAQGAVVIDKHEPGGYITPYEAAGEDATYISRIRTDPTVDNGLVLWCVSDNLRKGAALNAIQIAEVLINRKLISAKKKAA